MSHIDRAAIQQQLKARGIDPEHIRALHIQLQTGQLDFQTFVIEVERLRAPDKTDVVDYSTITAQAVTAGEEALRNDQLLVFWLNGGAATRYFDTNKIIPTEQQRYGQQLAELNPQLLQWPKGITPVVRDMSYLELKIRNLLKVTRELKLTVHPAVVLMNSFITDEPTRAHLAQLFQKYPELVPERFHFVIQQPALPRFQKVADVKNIDLFVDAQDNLSWAPCGHGDFVYLIQSYLATAHIPNVRYMQFANIDNLGATLDVQILGAHILSGQGRTVELVEKQAGDVGGLPCYVNGTLMIVEQMKLPAQFDQATVPWFNTNTFWFTLDALLKFKEDLPLVLAEKKLPAGAVWQFEHFACDVNLPSQFMAVPRAQRFWPIKRYVDLLCYQDRAVDQTRYSAFRALCQQAYDIQLD